MNLKEEMLASYVNEDGLGLIDSKHKRNDNGILFIAYWYALAELAGLNDESDCQRFISSVKKLEKERGLYTRFPGDNRPEAHDNYVGIIYGSLLFNTLHRFDIYQYGTTTGFCYNVTAPGVYDLKYVRQGGDVALYSISCGIPPQIVDYLWLLFGMLIGFAKGSPSVRNLCWLRTQILDLTFRKFDLPRGYALSYAVFSVLFSIIFAMRGGLRQSYKNYFPMENPLVKLAEELRL